MKRESGADQPTAPINDTPAPGTLGETNALLRELIGVIRENGAQGCRLGQKTTEAPPSPEQMAKDQAELRALIRAQIWRPKDE